MPIKGLHQFGRHSFVLSEPDEVAQLSQIHSGKQDKPTYTHTFYLPALHYQNKTAKIDDAEQQHYLIQQTLDTISMRFRSLEQLQDQNYMRPLNDTGLKHYLVLPKG